MFEGTTEGCFCFKTKKEKKPLLMIGRRKDENRIASGNDNAMKTLDKVSGRRKLGAEQEKPEKNAPSIRKFF